MKRKAMNLGLGDGEKFPVDQFEDVGEAIEQLGAARVLKAINAQHALYQLMRERADRGRQAMLEAQEKVRRLKEMDEEFRKLIG